MRLKLFLCGVTTLVPALLLSGCGMNEVSTITSNVQSPTVAGRTFAGQQPVSGATIEVVEMGTNGYGSPGTVLASTTTDSGGNFSFAPNAYACPQSDTPVYLMGIAGNTGAGNNPSAVLAAGLGTCANAKNSFVIMNEVSTTALAFSLAHFFSTTLGGSAGGNDWFGGPSTVGGGTVVYSRGLQMGNSYTIPTLVQTAVGAPVNNDAHYTVDWQKIDSIANTLAVCVNSGGAKSTTETTTPCGKLFNWTANGAVPRPSDTLQAAVQMALHPTVQVKNLFNLGTVTPPFIGLSSQPNDWSIGVSYTTPSVGLAVNTGTLSTLDIDSAGRIWFPSNASGVVGVAYFDPKSRSFNGPFNSTGLVHPQQVAIDANGYVWVNDSSSSTVPGYLTTAPSTTQSVSLPGTISNSLTISGDDGVNVGVTSGALYEQANISADRTRYSLLSGITFIYPQASMAGDDGNGDAVTVSDPATTSMRSYYVTSAPSEIDVVNANDNSGQVIYTGNTDISVRSFSGTGNKNDGLCIYSLAKCFNFTGALKETAEGMAIDGGQQLWVAESTNGLLQVPVNDPTNAFGSVYLNANNGNNVPVNELVRDSTGGATAPAPYGVGIDNEGNVWMTNASCVGTNCAANGFTLTEIVGAAYPTITPVSAQITSGNLVGAEPTN